MDMLKAILDIEKKAQKIASTFDASALEEKKKTDKILKELEEMELLKAREELNLAREQSEKSLKAELEEILNILTEKSRLMEQTFKENHEIWINEITQKITGGDTL